jgi:anthranilate synthase component 1
VVFDELLADMETPLSAYWKIASDGGPSFLLESVTGGEQLARFSILGTRPRKVITSSASDEDPLLTLEKEMRSGVERVPGMPKFIGGAVGMISYDYVRRLEDLPSPPRDDLQLPEVALMLVDSVVVFDHARNVIRILALAEPTEAGYDEALQEIERLRSLLQRPLPALPPPTPSSPGAVVSSVSQEQYEGMVKKAIDYIAAGDCIQVVLSQRYSQPTETDAVSLYRALRSLNPSPYMFLLHFDGFDVIGASPEILVSLDQRTARVRPIAGTRHRGDDAVEDDRLAAELLADEKERAEHVMLVDLGRNDLGRVCEYGSVEVRDLMTIEKYSHVMHIVSDVSGKLPDDKDAFDLLRACFPAGTVSGAPKVRAMEIIDELEATRRGLYAGAVGYLSASGDMDMAIAIRTILLKDGQAHVQAGAGIVFDSQPVVEFEECRNKAKACLRAVEVAAELHN